MILIRIIEREGHTVQVTHPLPLLCLLQEVVVGVQLLLITVVLILILNRLLPLRPEQHELLNETLDRDVHVRSAVGEVVVDHLGQGIVGDPEELVEVLLDGGQCEVLHLLDGSIHHKLHVFEEISTDVHEHWQDAVRVEVITNVSLHCHDLVVVLVHIGHRLRHIHRISQPRYDLATSKVLKHIKDKKGDSKLEVDVFAELILVDHHYILTLIEVLCLLKEVSYAVLPAEGRLEPFHVEVSLSVIGIVLDVGLLGSGLPRVVNRCLHLTLIVSLASSILGIEDLEEVFFDGRYLLLLL